jgi:hypothetical protein
MPVKTGAPLIVEVVSELVLIDVFVNEAGMPVKTAAPLMVETLNALVLMELFVKLDGIPVKIAFPLIELTPKFPTPVIGPLPLMVMLRTDFITTKSVPFADP